MDHRSTYRVKVKVGNWTEDRLLTEDKDKEHQEKKARGGLTCQRADFLKQNLFEPVQLAVTSDGNVHFGDTVMLVNAGGENRERRAMSVNAEVNDVTKTPSPGIRAPCGVSAGGGTGPCVRTAFIITSVDGSPEGSTLRYEQSFALKTTSGFARGLYLTSDMKTLQKCAKKSRLQEVNLEAVGSFLSRWKVVYLDPQERLENEGQPVPANVKVLIVHCRTNQALAVLGDQVLWNTCGKEYEVTAHTFLDSHKVEQENNHWILCTADLTGNPRLTANEELTQPNPDNST